MTKRPVAIEAVWDRDSGQWSACSAQLPGLSAGAATLNLLVDTLRERLPELVDDPFMLPGESALNEALGTTQDLIDLAQRLA